jgi:hypothetical protein
VIRYQNSSLRYFFSDELLFIEPGLSRGAKWQRRLNGAQRVFGDGCRLVCDFRELIPRGGFEFDEISEYYREKAPRTHGYTHRGIAAIG